MAARVIYFGTDECYRLSVLRRAGYDIENCSNLDELCEALEPDEKADAVMVNDSDGSMPFHAISLVRTCTTAPIILFPNSIRAYRAAEADLVVPAFTPPEEWLLDLANLIVQTRALRAYSRPLGRHSESLRQEAFAVRVKSVGENETARRIVGTRFPSPFYPDWGSK